MEERTLKEDMTDGVEKIVGEEKLVSRQVFIYDHTME